MNNKMVINYVPGPTTLHKLTGGTKVLLFVLLSVGIIATFDIRILVPLMVLSLVAIASMKPSYKPLLFLYGFMFITTGVIGNIMLLLVSPDVGLTHVGGHTVLVQWTEKLYLTRETLWYMFVYFFKRSASFTVVMAFVLSTTPSEFASGLAFMGLPYKVCTIVSLAYRTIPDIANKFMDIRNSIQMRGVELSKKASIGNRLKNTVSLLVPLIISSFARVEVIANAMDLRGYGRLKKRTWYAEHELTKADRVLRVAAIVLAALILFYIAYFRIINPYPVNMWSPFLSVDELIIRSPLEDIFFLKWFQN